MYHLNIMLWYIDSKGFPAIQGVFLYHHWYKGQAFILYARNLKIRPKSTQLCYLIGFLSHDSYCRQ